MKNSIIDKIDKAIKDNENNAIETLNTIKALIASERKPDFTKIKDGEHFTYKGIEFIRLGKEQGGILCITAKIWKTLPFDKDGCNNFKKASICKVLNNEFRPLLDDNDLLTYQMDLTADNGDKAYGYTQDFFQPICTASIVIIFRLTMIGYGSAHRGIAPVMRTTFVV